MRRLFVLGMLLWAPAVWAHDHKMMPQSPGCSGYAFTATQRTVLLPKDAAAQGVVTGTITGDGGAGKSHNMTVTPGTVITIAVNSANATSAQVYWYQNGTKLGPYTYPLSGTQTWTAVNPGTTYVWKYIPSGPNGNSQDRLTIVVVPGNTPNVVKQDGLDTNFYYQPTFWFGGGDMAHNCQICIDYPSSCSGAQHTPYITASVTNNMTGEVASLPRQVAGSVVSENDPISGSGTVPFISFLPGDTTDESGTGEIFCTAIGDDIFNQNPPNTTPTGGSIPTVNFELAFTKIALKTPRTCLPILNKAGAVIGQRCAIAYYCSPRSSPPDYQPTNLDDYHDTIAANVPPFWMAFSFPGVMVSAGNQVLIPWQFPAANLQAVYVNMGMSPPWELNIFNAAWVSDNSTKDCTNWLKGIDPWYMPTW